MPTKPVPPTLAALIAERFPGAAVEPLAEDASTRSFYRLRLVGGGTCIVMDYGQPFEEETNDLRLTRIFSAAQLPVARILEQIPTPGCLVLEDLGPEMLEDRLVSARDQGQTPDLWVRAAELAGRVARDGSPVLARSSRAGGPSLDFERFSFEMGFFIENYVEGYRKIRGGGPKLRAALTELARRAAETPRRVLCHRDFHSRNLIVRADGTIAMLDIQDGQWGPDTYDLASLICDAYVDLAPNWVEDAIVAFVRIAEIDDGQAFRNRLHLVSAQRMIKALGTFGFQIEIARNERYLSAIPRTLNRLNERMGRNEETQELHELFSALDLLSTTP